MDKKKAYLFSKYLHAEMNKINEDKWYEGEHIGRDPGTNYIVDWVNKNAANWRTSWEKSKCQHCSWWRQCGHSLKEQCDKFILDPIEDWPTSAIGE